MKFSTIIFRLNWPQVLLHMIAIWLFSAAIQTYSYLSDPDFLGDLINAKQQGLEIKDILKTDERFPFTDFYYYSIVGSFTGMLIGFIISLVISIRGKGFWLNSILSLLLFFLISRLGLSKPYFLKAIFRFPGLIIQKDIILSRIINASILLALGIIAFFMSNTNNKIIRLKKSVV